MPTAHDHVLRVLGEGRATVHDIVAKSGSSYESVRKVVYALIQEGKVSCCATTRLTNKGGHATRCFELEAAYQTRRRKKPTYKGIPAGKSLQGQYANWGGN